MQCFYVLVHGRLSWLPERAPSDKLPAERPAGFYCHRYVLAPNEAVARDKAFHRVRDNLMSLLEAGAATVELEAEEIAVAPMYKLMKPDNRGHTFYETE